MKKMKSRFYAKNVESGKCLIYASVRIDFFNRNKLRHYIVESPHITLRPKEDLHLLCLWIAKTPTPSKYKIMEVQEVREIPLDDIN